MSLRRLDDGPSAMDWSAYDLNAIWKMVENEDGTINWIQRDAWDRSAKLCEDQADHLTRAVAALQEHWPAHPGSASAAFGTFINQLVTSMRQSAADARANYDAITSITVDISVAQIQVLSLISDHATYLDAEKANQPHKTPSPGDPVPKQVPPPPANWRQMLDHDARQYMSTMDVNVGEQFSKIATNRASDVLQGGAITTIDPGSAGSSGGSYHPSVPITPYNPPPIGIGTVPAPVPTTTPTSDDPGWDPGTVLDGGTVTVAPGNPLAWAPGAGIGSPGWAPSAGAFGGGYDSGGALPIGIQPVAAETGPGSTGSGGTGSAAGSAGGRTGSTTPPMIGAPYGTAGRRAGAAVSPGGTARGYRDRNRRRDPRDPWAAKEGTPAIIEPVSDEIDDSPGPGVLGIDR